MADRTSVVPAREREALIRSVLGHLPQAVVYQIEAQPGGARHFTYLSGAVTALFACTPEEAIADPRRIYGTIAEEDRPRLAAEEERCLRELVPFNAEIRVRVPSREERWIYASSAPRRRGDGTIIWDGVIVDVTGRKRAEEELRRAREGLETLLENSPLAVIEWSSADYRIVRWSDQATKVFGWTAGEALGKRIDELPWIHPDDRHLVEAVSADMLSGARPHNVTRNRNVRKDGAVIHCEWYNSTLCDPEGRFSVLSLVLDVTERTRAEDALREADRAKNEFLAVLSHELRNPLAPIKNSLYILDRAVAGGEQARRAQAIVARQVDQLTRLVDDLLDVTRIARGRLALQCSRLELGQLVRRTLEDYRPVFETAGVCLDLEAGPAAVHVHADAHRIAQVVGNLLHNAAKFTPRGGRVTVTVATDAAAARAVVSVADTGLGLTPEVSAHLFEPFMQAAEALDRREGGLGLGLALVKGVVELHGGDVSASSAGPGRGSRFVVRLPLDRNETAPVERRATAARGRHRRVLVIEDNVDAADSLRDVLRIQGHEVAVAYDGAAGIARAREFHPEVVLCDIGLPGVDGYEVARAFRADEALRGAHLVALSGYALAEDLQRAFEAGFEQHLAKPPSLERLKELLQGTGL